MSALPASFVSRFRVDESTGCWLWQGARTEDGYGRYRHEGAPQRRAHRFAYETAVGPIPAGLVLDHLCRTPSCVNPDHLEPVTTRENTLRGVSAAAQLAAASECKRGHPLVGDNLILERRPNRSIGFQRRCRTCRLEHYRNRRARAA